MAHEIQIRVGSDGVYVTAVDGKRRADIARIPRTTGAGQTFTVDDLAGRHAHALKTRDDVKADGDAPLKVADDEPNATDRAIELATEHDIDLSTIDGSGPGGRVYADDVKALIDEGESAGVEAEPTE